MAQAGGWTQSATRPLRVTWDDALVGEAAVALGEHLHGRLAVFGHVAHGARQQLARLAVVVVVGCR